MRHVLLGAALSISLAQASFAQSSNRALAEKYVNLPGVQRMITEMSSPTAMAAQFATQLPPNVNLSQDQKMRIGEILSDIMTKLRPSMVAQMISGSAETFTTTELEVLIDFYSSEHGAAIMGKMQPFMLGVMAQLAPEIQAAQQAALPDILKIIEDQN